MKIYVTYLSFEYPDDSTDIVVRDTYTDKELARKSIIAEADSWNTVAFKVLPKFQESELRSA